ncbi:phosphate signaling complex protein PhoU [Cumulibacter manganitolerans]|uniref:phosphate signaling complex protein PhoU n=1 Tax=Cumulibacter manganitolerans TaxID=1884992 RepID=UPI001297962B|nr:phosphate signaling complex protein PhoU [Cumulibacter manganitolerans]
MRQTFQDDLDQVSHQLVEMTNLAGSAITRATTALMDADITLAESVIDGDAVMDDIRKDIEAHAFDLLARQQPVATDLRIVVTALQMAIDLERMGDLAAHIAKVARMRYPNSALPQPVRPVILEMAQSAARNVAKAGTTISSRDAERALELETDDDNVDALHRELFRILLDDDWSYGVEAAIDITLLGRYYERFSDHAVAVARRVIYVVTGEHTTPETLGADETD